MPVDSEALDIILYPDPRLRERTREIPAITEEVRRVAARMIELMRRAEGIGLAAPQVGLPWRMFVCHVPEADENSLSTDPPSASAEPFVYINPRLVNPQGPVEKQTEGCLSIPDILGDVLRPPIITIEATDLSGARVTRTASGLLARCWQHETDHLDGVLILNRMTHLSRLKARSAVRSLERAARTR